MVSTDPAHSLSDSFAQDVSGGEPVQIEGTTLPIWGMEIDADDAKRTFQSASTSESKGVRHVHVQVYSRVTSTFGIARYVIAKVSLNQETLSILPFQLRTAFITPEVKDMQVVCESNHKLLFQDIRNPFPLEQQTLISSFGFCILTSGAIMIVS